MFASPGGRNGAPAELSPRALDRALAAEPKAQQRRGLRLLRATGGGRNGAPAELSPRALDRALAAEPQAQQRRGLRLLRATGGGRNGAPAELSPRALDRALAAEPKAQQRPRAPAAPCNGWRAERSASGVEPATQQAWLVSPVRGHL